jgi:hypothetical protein
MTSYERNGNIKPLTFYQGGIFEPRNACTIYYFGEVSRMDTARRKDLFPNDGKPNTRLMIYITKCG